MPDERMPVVVSPTGGELIDAGGDRYRFLATRESTNGTYGIWEAIVPPGGGPPPHIHTREEEGFYVIDGEVMVHAGDTAVLATAGSFVNMPVGVKHWFRNESSVPAKMLVLVAPGGMEAMFQRTGTPVANASDPIPPLGADEKQRILAAAPDFGIALIPPGH